ncbi:MAG: DUF1467 family protein [Pseudomonadota bacterium]|nr:DUF1467 family protein [Pseudomonadota bacterium]
MGIFSAVVVYVLTWWMVLFCLLPINIETIDKPKDGAMPGAPVQAGIKRKALVATGVSFVIWGAICLIIIYGGISFHDQAAKMAM